MSAMIVTSVKSSNIASVSYDPDTQELQVQFQNGSQYSYAGVSQDVFDAFTTAESVGNFFHRKIRGKFPHTKIEKKEETSKQGNGEAQKP